ncbi:MAG: UDP-N-acetylmuramoyl-L-alanine--D-glutamate ligase, partial [Muribaculaceae bacterium]|nr:UDP-N-acetylmuramoyl-L-alanine--D-glutamate ligase [Muribaculaceae bacterium]
MTDIDKIRHIAVLGAGESGVGAAILAMSRGIGVLVSDSGKIPAKYRDILTARGIPFEEGGHTEDVILKADMVVKSPGIPPT